MLRLTSGSGYGVGRPTGSVIIERTLFECVGACATGVSIDIPTTAQVVNVHHNTIRNFNNCTNCSGLQVYVTSPNDSIQTAQISYNNIYSNSKYDLTVRGEDPEDTLDSENNWWGTTDPAEIEASVYHHNDDINVPWVDYEPFASGPIPGAP